MTSTVPGVCVGGEVGGHPGPNSGEVGGCMVGLTDKGMVGESLRKPVILILG